MDYIDWCHYVLEIFEKEKKYKNKQYLDWHELPSLIFDKTVVQQRTFHDSEMNNAMFETLEILENAGLIDNTYAKKIFENMS
jgi:hypothetical protein